MKWFAQYFISPFIAAALAIWGNYYFVEKGNLEKEYTKIGVDILSNKDAPENVRILGKQLLNANSPISLTDAEQDLVLLKLVKDIPFVLIEEKATWGELAVNYGVLLRWVGEVSAVCSDCFNEEMFDEYYTELKPTIYNGRSN